MEIKDEANQSSSSPAVEHDLERAKKGRDQHEAEEIESGPLLPHLSALCSRRLGLAQNERDQREREHADRGINQKAPAPGEIVG